MYKILTILLLISFTSISQVKDNFSKYDSLLMKEINILRKSYGLNELSPSLKLRRNVTNIHTQYLKNVNPLMLYIHKMMLFFWNVILMNQILPNFLI